MQKPLKPPNFDEHLMALKPKRLLDILAAVKLGTVNGSYIHWDQLRYRNPPASLKAEEWWVGLKMRRKASSRIISLRDSTQNHFQFTIPDAVSDLLHQIDRERGDDFRLAAKLKSNEQQAQYKAWFLMEEAITSSQLEGAATTREVAKKMLAENRPPRDQSERMIFNNFRTMQQIKSLKDENLSPSMIFEIHRLISEGALDTPHGEGRFRRTDEDINVSDIEGNVFHIPPPAAELPKRLQELCDFANEKTPDYFIHPLIRAIILHFWLAYDHPFVDGNGRTARALFYSQMIRSGYWLFEYISISHYLRKAPVQYGKAFLYTETDENDLTYFIVHEVDIIRQALKDLQNYITRQSRELEQSLDLLKSHPGLNHRQHALITHALRHGGATYTIAEHKMRHGIVYESARTDLLILVKIGLFEKRKRGRAFVFVPAADLEKRLRN